MPSSTRSPGEPTDAGSAVAAPTGATVFLAVNRLREAERMLEHRACVRLGLRSNDFRTLQFIAASDQAGTVARPKELAESLGVTGAAASLIVERLVERGVARRSRDDADRRSRLLSLTPLGRRELADVYGDMPDALRGLLDELAPNEAKRILDLAIAVQGVVDRTALPLSA